MNQYMLYICKWQHFANNLSLDGYKTTYCVTGSSVNMFKNKVDTYIRRAGYK